MNEILFLNRCKPGELIKTNTESDIQISKYPNRWNIGFFFLYLLFSGYLFMHFDLERFRRSDSKGKQKNGRFSSFKLWL